MRHPLSDRQAALLWSHLNVLTRERYEAVLTVFGSLEAAASEVDAEFLRRLGCREDTVEGAMRRLDTFSPDREETLLAAKGIEFLRICDERYPARLEEIADAPPFLYVRGDLRALDRVCVGLVGTRKASAYGEGVARAFVPPLTRAGAVTVSGLAEGIDALVARETLAAGGATVAVLAHGLGTVYPASNRVLADGIVEGGGLLVSEYPYAFGPAKHTFPARNRIIAGLSVATVVFEAPSESGALITAELALEYSRDVYAVPGRVTDPGSEGCNALIARDRARLVASPGDLLRHLGLEENAVPPYAPQDETERALLRALTHTPRLSDELIAETGFDPGIVASALTMMELSGGARNVGGGLWVRA